MNAAVLNGIESPLVLENGLARCDWVPRVIHINERLRGTLKLLQKLQYRDAFNEHRPRGSSIKPRSDYAIDLVDTANQGSVAKKEWIRLYEQDIEVPGEEPAERALSRSHAAVYRDQVTRQALQAGCQ